MYHRVGARTAWIGIFALIFGARVSQAVVDGEVDRSGQHPYVVALHLSAAGKSGMCSGVIVHPKIILTAAHCLDGWNLDRITNATKSGRRPRNALNAVKFAKIEQNPDYIALKAKLKPKDHMTPYILAENDFAYVMLHEPIPTNLPVASIRVTDPQVNAEDLRSLPVLLAGFGSNIFKFLTSDENDAADDSSEFSPMTWGIRRTARNQVANSFIQGLLTFENTPPVNALAKGDSGGPVLDDRQNPPSVVAINVAVQDRHRTSASRDSETVRTSYALVLQPHLMNWVQKSTGWDWSAISIR